MEKTEIMGNILRAVDAMRSDAGFAFGDLDSDSQTSVAYSLGAIWEAAEKLVITLDSMQNLPLTNSRLFPLFSEIEVDVERIQANWASLEAVMVGADIWESETDE